MSEGRRFHLLRQLGAGGHGEVYLAEQESQAGFRRKVALKVLRSDLGHNDQAAMRMRDEARILGRLSHRHIVGVSDLVRLDNRWAVVMDYVPGADLDRILEALTQLGERFPPRAAIETAVAVLRALHAAWTVDNGEGAPLKLIHRDIKPSNILLAEDGALKVLDFGVARVDLGTREAETGAVRPGTLRYMAPERLLGEEETPAGDTYATAISIMELLVGEPLGRTPIIDEKHQAYIDAAVEAAKSLAPEHEGYATALEGLAAAMAGDPDERPTAGELEAVLSGVVGNLPGEDLNSFAHRIIPQVTELLGDTSEAITGTMHEATSATANATLADFGSSRIEPLPTPDPADAEPKPQPDPGGFGTLTYVGMGVAAALALVLVCGGGGAALAVALGQPTTVAGTQDDTDAVALVEVEDSDPPEAPVDTDVQAETDAPTVDPDVQDSDAQGTAEDPDAGSTRPPPIRRPVVRPDPPPETPTVPADAPRVSAAMFVFPEASALKVRCGDVERAGTASVRLRNLPAGSCVISATYLQQSLTAKVEVTERREVRCAIQDGSLACR